tara:strand:+ start:190 stop:309 length:120 start_codon:yes stop_codon:yes gene_type:complete
MKAPFGFDEFLILLVGIAYFGAMGYGLYLALLAISNLIN